MLSPLKAFPKPPLSSQTFSMAQSLLLAAKWRVILTNWETAQRWEEKLWPRPVSAALPGASFPSQGSCARGSQPSFLPTWTSYSVGQSSLSHWSKGILSFKVTFFLCSRPPSSFSLAWALTGMCIFQVSGSLSLLPSWFINLGCCFVVPASKSQRKHVWSNFAHYQFFNHFLMIFIKKLLVKPEKRSPSYLFSAPPCSFSSFNDKAASDFPESFRKSNLTTK